MCGVFFCGGDLTRLLICNNHTNTTKGQTYSLLSYPNRIPLSETNFSLPLSPFSAKNSLHHVDSSTAHHISNSWARCQQPPLPSGACTPASGTQLSAAPLQVSSNHCSWYASGQRQQLGLTRMVCVLVLPPFFCLTPCREDGKPENVTEEIQQQLASAATSKKPTDTRLSPEQLKEVGVCALMHCIHTCPVCKRPYLSR